MAIFCAAIPVGSALGYVIGGAVGAHFGWRWAFYVVAPAGFDSWVALLSRNAIRASRSHHLVQKSPRRGLSDYLKLFQTRSYLVNCIAQTLMTFAAGGLGYLDVGVFELSQSEPGSCEDHLRIDNRGRGTDLDVAWWSGRRQTAPAFSWVLFLGFWESEC